MDVPVSPRARRYEPLVKIASGGTAAVWVGAPRGVTGPLVAIKRPHAHLADDPSFRRALVAEATIASRLAHPNVVDVRDVEEDDDGIALVMRYVEGCSLSELIRSWSREPPPRAAACALRVALDTCAGLVALHDLRDEAGRLLGLVHRDVSPANVLVGTDGVASIADFGLAKPLYAVERTTSEGALRGKLGYMAPEYVRGKDIDLRIDVFAMGVVVWEALARKRLFRGENDAATLDRVQRLEAPRIGELVPELGPAAEALDTVLGRALAKDPAERTASAGDLARELADVARLHGLEASHAEVAASFGPALRASLEERRARVDAALASRTREVPVAVATEEPTVRTREPRSRVLPWALGAVLVTGGAIVGLRAVQTPRAADARADAGAAPPSASADASATPPQASAQASATPVPPSASAAPAVRRPPPAADPGRKKPRPNPYSP